MMPSVLPPIRLVSSSLTILMTIWAGVRAFEHIGAHRPLGDPVDKVLDHLDS